MKKLDMQKRLASDLLKAGKSRVRFRQEMLDEVKEAITREDIKSLISKGAIIALPKKGVSRGRAKALHEQRKKGRRKGHGKRKGAKKARTPKKRAWINKIRPQRTFLRLLKEKKRLTNTQFRKLYRLAKAGYFRSRRHLKLYTTKLTGDNK
jgi:large subunit ribosomal protein L19e